MTTRLRDLPPEDAEAVRQRIYQLKDKGIPIKKIREVVNEETGFNISYENVRHILLNKPDKEEKLVEQEIPDAPPKPEREAVELRAALKRTQGALARAKAKSEDLVAAVYQASYDAAVSLGNPEPIPAPSYALSKGKPEVALLHATDWQYGKRTESYNRQVCEERIALLGDKVEELTTIQRAAHPVDSIHLMFGGDMLEGLNIFPGQAYEVDSELFTQLFGVAKLQEELIRRLLGIFKQVEVWAEEGNHGRIGRKGEWPRTDNTDMMAYEVTRQKLEGEERVIWHPRKSWYQLVEVGEYSALLIHGDEIKSFGGNTPAFGLLRKGTAWSSGVTEPFRDIYYGHYHTAMSLTLPNGGTMYGTGSTESDNVYAQEFVAAKGKPSQRLHFIDPRRGRVTAEYKVYLSEED